MERKITADLLKWKKEVNRKPLLLYGNKQIGKTYSVIDFGEKEYKTVAYINSDNNIPLLTIMKKERTIDKIIAKLSLLVGEPILKTDTLVIIDNVRDEEIVKGVKKFGKEPNDYHIIMITSHKEKLPVFKGEELQYKYMFAMDFEEYLRAVNNLELIEFIKTSYRNNKPMPFHQLALDYYEEYLMTGGMPEVVEAHLNGESDLKLKMIQEKILDCYKKELLEIEKLIANEEASKMPDLTIVAGQVIGGGSIKDGVEYSEEAEEKIKQIEELGFGKLPVCIAKTQYSLSDDPKNLECLEPFKICVKDIILKSGSEFVVAITGKIMTMPGLPKVPAAEKIDLDKDGNIIGIF